MNVSMILAESGLEKIPREFLNDKRVQKSCASVGHEVRKCLLDRSLHHWLLKTMPDGEKRGRPDIAYHVLLDVADSLLYKQGQLDFFIHTYDNNVIKIGRGLRPPRSYFRFEGLMIDLFKKGRIEAKGRPLLEIEKMSLSELFGRVGKPIIGLSSSGKRIKIEELANKLARTNGTFVVGGFAKGDFSDATIRAFDELYSINPASLEATTVSVRLIYELEKIAGLWD